MNGFILQTRKFRADANAPGGKSELQLIAIAASDDDAIAIAARLGYPSATVIEKGAEIMIRAKSLGVNENEAKVRSKPPL